MLGIYDTGLGGFTLIPEIKNIFPTLDITFLADTEALPLGEKTDQEIKTRVFAAVDYLWSRGCEVIILACNTATCICIQELQSAHPQKSVLGITRTLTESLERRGINKDKIVSILGTTATIQSGYYQQELNGFGYHDLLEIPSKNLARDIERSDLPGINKELEDLWKAKLRDQKPTVILLACTHYPLIQDHIQNFYLQKYNYKPQLISHLEGFSHKFYSYALRKGLNLLESGNIEVLCTSYPQVFQDKVVSMFSEFDLGINFQHLQNLQVPKSYLG